MRARLPSTFASLARAGLPLALAALAACGPSFTPFREIEKSRVIGATVTVDADPTLFTPAPGDAATFRLIAADPGPRVGRTYAMVLCVPGASQLDIVFCGSDTQPVTAVVSNTLPGPTDPKPDPELHFTVPNTTVLGDADELWLMGAVCNGGQVRDIVTDGPVFGQPWEPCMPDPTATEPPYGQLITTRIKLNRVANDVNHNPAYATLTFDGMPFTAVPPDDAAETGCVGQGFPEIVADGTAHLIDATVPAGTREVYVPEGFTDSYPEDVFLLLFRTGGTLFPAFGVIDDTSSVAEIEYTPTLPTPADPSGTLVRFWLQLKDDRDASTWAARAVCVTPGP